MKPKKGSAYRSASKDEDLARDTHEAGEFLTTNQGLRVGDDQNSLRVGERGPTLLEDFHLREKITHFDNERIPERVVHARGAAAHGYFQVYEPMAEWTKANFLQDPSKKTPVFVRFSTVVGSRGSADTPRDVRGFAVKFYTDEGVFDLVGNNMPVFFIQDAVKFPDFVHAVKPEPHREIPQAGSAHDTFWDFASLSPEVTHMLMWVMSDRAFPRSFSMMEGFGVHTFRLSNAQGKSRFVKFHFKPLAGIHSLVWDEAQKIAGKDPDFNRRDMWDAIERGNFPEWEFGVQIIEEEDECTFDFDLLDPTKLVPEELVPVRRIGKLTLNRNPDNYFAETEQVAFHPGHIVPGIDFSNDPLLQGRLFSYLDTQLKRVGPNFAELPINRPTCPFHNNQRDGMGRITINKGPVSYFPNSLGDNRPAHSPDAAEAFTSYAEKIDGHKIRKRSESFSDHFSQATLFWNSMSAWEKAHIVDAFSFELNMVETQAIRERVLNGLLTNVHGDLARSVAMKTGIALKVDPKAAHDRSSPALSMDKSGTSIKGRTIAILIADGVDGSHVAALHKQLEAAGAVGVVVARFAGAVQTASGQELAVDRAAPNAPSVLYDAVFVPGGRQSAAALSQSGMTLHFINEAFFHGKPIAVIGEGVEVLQSTQLKSFINGGKAVPGLGIVIARSGDEADSFIKEFFAAIAQHRNFHRDIDMIPA